MKKKIYRIGSVGLGGIAQGVHLPGIQKSPDLELAAICDLKPERVREVQEQYGIDDAHCFTDFHDLVRCPDVDAVDIATSNDAHFMVAKASIEAGKPYALEKPVTMTAQEADTLLSLSQEHGVPNMVCFSYRYKAAARYARDLIAEGTLGEIYHVYMRYLQGGGGPDYDLPLSWRYVKKRTGTGALGDLGCHALDLVTFITGLGYQKVVSHMDTYVKSRRLEDGSGSGTVDVDDFCHYLMELDGRTSADFEISRFAYGRGNYQKLEIYGSRGALLYSLDEAGPNVDEIRLCAGKPYGFSGTFVPMPVPQRYQADQMQSFADVLNGCADGLSATIQQGCSVQHALEAIETSSETRTWVDIE